MNPMTNVGKPSHQVHLRRDLSNSLPLFRELLAARASLKETAQVAGAAKTLSQPNRKLRPHELEQLVANYLTGTDIATLARSYGMHRQTVRNHLLRRGVTLRSDSPVPSETQIDRLVELYASGLSTAKVGKLVGSNASTVQRALKARGVKLRDRTGR